MTAFTDQNKADKSMAALTENQNLIAVNDSKAKCNQEIALSNNELRNQLEQKYYDRASGCSVKAQVHNLFDDKSRSK